MPIKDLSEVVRLPRIGKIALGTRHPDKNYPMKSDHFVFRKDQPLYDELVKIYGEKSTELRILIPTEDEETWATQYYKQYSMTYGLVCRGDGEIAVRMVDEKTQQIPSGKEQVTVEMIDYECKGETCPDFLDKKCHRVMNLKFILPEIPGLGVWQIDTTSRNSIININSCAKIIRRAFGRVSMIPLLLSFEPQKSKVPETGKQQTIYVLHLRSQETLLGIAERAKEQANLLTIGRSELEQAFEVQVQKDIDELWDGIKREDEPEVVEPSEAPENKMIQEPAAMPTPSKSEPVDEQGSGEPSEADKAVLELEDKINYLQEKKQSAWYPKNINSYLKALTKREESSWKGQIKHMSEAQIADFKKKVEEAVALAG